MMRNRWMIFNLLLISFILFYILKRSNDFRNLNYSFKSSSFKFKTSNHLQSFHRHITPKFKPLKPFSPLPRFSLEENFTYENVRPSPNQLINDPLNQKFMTYLPHSGFHNQRIEIINAFKLAKLLNRTLILPELRLGKPIAWSNSNLLPKVLEDQIKSWNSNCLNNSKILNDLDGCQSYLDWTSTQVNYLLNIQNLTLQQPIIDRFDMRESWLWETLQLSFGDWFEVIDDSRYSYQIFESKNILKNLDPKYNWRLNIEELKKLDHIRLLSFGSLFGSNRIITSSQEMKDWNQKINLNQLPNVPILNQISNQVSHHLGGRGNFIGLHLRLGNLIFKSQAPQVMPEIFRKVCKKFLNLNENTIQKLFLRHKKILQSKSKIPNQFYNDHFEIKTIGKQFNWMTNHNNLPSSEISNFNSYHQFLNKRFNSTPISPRKCKGKLYKEPELEPLNVPIYIATDISHPQDHPHTSIFFETFPCVFILDDFRETYLKPLDKVRSNQDGLLLKGFLYPILDAMIASKGFGIIGTPKSTFSSYAINQLHPAYLSEIQNQLY